ncbi:MAG TPA: hypothetical protein PKE69_11325 [Pyrinomonadaceae bacterium]|nr:hypothetical protein [Pyrinomonadaceae bacterium]
MGFLEDIGAVATGTYAMKKQLERRNEAWHRITSGELRQDVETLISGLDTLDSVMQGAEYGTYMTDYAEKTSALRGKLGNVKDIISKPLDYYDALDDIWTFVNTVKDASRFIPGKDPLGEAKVYGSALKSLGKITKRIPLLNIYSSFFEEMGNIFAQTVANIVPHLKGTHQRVDDQWKRANGGKGIWD